MIKLTSKLPRFVLAGLAAASLSMVSSIARATPEMRAEMQGQAGMLTHVLPCSVCHEHGNTGIGSVRTPFGLSVRLRGLDIDASDLPTNAFDVVEKMKADHVDSDGDRVEDIAELQADTDPNTPGPVPLENRDEVGYGCHCRYVGALPQRSSHESLGLIGAGLMLAVAVRRARRRASHSPPRRRTSI